jgi:hypothetical protein
MPSKYVPPLLQDAIVLGFWGAATIKVFGYTWEAVKASWTTIGDIGAGSTQNVSAVAKAGASASLGHSFGPFAPVVSALTSVSNFPLKLASKIPIIGGLFAGLITPAGAMSSAERKRLNSLPNPPKALVAQVRATTPGTVGARQANNAFRAWAKSHGWQPNDVNLYFGYLSVAQLPAPQTGTGGKQGTAGVR